MKKLLAVMVVVMLVAVGGEAFGVCYGPECYGYDKNTNVQGQIQGQAQGQAQVAIVGVDVGLNQEMNQQQSFPAGEIRTRILTAPEVEPYVAPIYQNGKLDNYTSKIPNISGAVKLATSDVIVKVLRVVDGMPGWRVRVEDLIPKIISNSIAGNRVRYFVIEKGAVTSGGLSLGGAVSAPIGNGMGTGSVPMGYSESTYNPQYVITFVEVK
jgi:hypothetical protein